MSEPNKKRRILLLSLCILLLGGIAAEGVLIAERLRQEPAVLPAASSEQPERDPEQELLDAVQADDYVKVTELCSSFYAEESLPETVTAALHDRITALQAAYDAETTDADTVQTTLRSIAMLGLPDITQEASGALEAVRLHEAARTIYRQAEKYAAAAAYPEAIETYGRVPKTETECYQAAQEQIEECRKRLREKTAADAAAAFAAGDTETADRLLQEALEILPDDETLTALLAEIAAAQQTAMRRSFLAETGVLFGKGDYAGAFAKLNALPAVLQDDAVVQGAAENWRQKYLRELPYRVMQLLESGEHDAAAAAVSEAETIAPDAESLPELCAKIEEYEPRLLSALTVHSFADFIEADAPLTDCGGNQYAANGNLYCTYDGTLSGRQFSSGAFSTEGKYNWLTLTAAPLEGFDPTRTVFLEIVGDGKVIERYTMTAKTGVLHIRQTIKGVKTLSLRVVPAGTDDLRKTAVILAEGTVSKS